MNNKTAGIVATAASTLLCGCPGLFLCVFGGLVAIGAPVTTEAGGQTSVQTYPPGIGVLAVLFSAILIAIPVVLGILTVRSKSGQPRATAAPAPAPSPVSAPAPQPAVAASQPEAGPSAAPPAGMDASAQEVYNRLMALNRATAPYHIIDGKAENVDLIAEWKIVDAQWYEVFAKASLTKVFSVYLKLDPTKREVRAMDREYNVQWSAGVPRLSLEASFFKGQKSEVSFGTGYAFTEELAPGQVYKYKFNTKEIKKPIQDAVASCGWKYKAVALGKL